MKKFFLVLCVAMSFMANAQLSWNLTLLSHFNDPNLPKIGTQTWNGCEGWADPIKHREYAIAGSVDSVYFFDITDPLVMKKCAVQDGKSHAENRDFAVYDHYLYAVSDNIQSGSTPGVMQIFDMQYLPDSVHKVYESSERGANTHTVFINSKSKRLYKCINRYRDITGITLVNAMEIYSLKDPEEPTVMATLSRDNYADVHECYSKNDTVFCSSGNAGLFIYDMTDTAHIQPLGSIIPPYPENAYNHSNWLDSTGQYMLFTDETADGKGMKVYDITDLANPKLVAAPFRNYGAPHNSYWVGRYAFTSMYYGGVNVYDMKNVNAPDFVAYYRTFPDPHTPYAYEGCWGIYPFLPSGNIIASDMNTGIFLLKLNYTMLGVKDENKALSNISAYPNPFTQQFTLRLSSAEKQVAHLLVYDLQGKIAAENMLEINAGDNTIAIDGLQNAPRGLYIIKIISPAGVYHQSIIKLQQ